MRQLVLGFASEQASVVALQPEIEGQLVTLMARAILAVADNDAREGGRIDDADAVEPQDHEGASEAQGGGLRTPVQPEAGA